MPRLKKGNTIGFQKGNTLNMRRKKCTEKSESASNKSVYMRPDAETYELAKDKPVYGLRPQESCEGRDAKILRPRKTTKEDTGTCISEHEYERYFLKFKKHELKKVMLYFK